MFALRENKYCCKLEGTKNEIIISGLCKICKKKIIIGYTVRPGDRCIASAVRKGRKST